METDKKTLVFSFFILMSSINFNNTANATADLVYKESWGQSNGNTGIYNIDSLNRPADNINVILYGGAQNTSGTMFDREHSSVSNSELNILNKNLELSTLVDTPASSQLIALQFMGGFSAWGHSTNNTVSLLASDLTINSKNTFFLEMRGGAGSQYTKNNKVLIADSKITLNTIFEKSFIDIYGGSSSSQGEVHSNMVDISNTTITNNTGSIENITNIIGGDNTQLGNSLKYNKVALNNVTFNVGTNGNSSINIIGGRANNSSADINYNTVELAGEINFNTGASVNILGGKNIASYTNGDIRSGNRLIINDTNISHVNMEIKNFEEYEFIIGDNYDKSEAFITGDNIYLGEEAKLKITFNASKASKIGDEILLINSTNLDNADTAFIETDETKEDWWSPSITDHTPDNTISGIHYDTTVEKVIDTTTNVGQTALNAKVTGVKASELSKSFSAARITNIAFTNQSADAIFNQGIASARKANFLTRKENVSDKYKDQISLSLFASVSGGYSAYDVGQTIGLSGISSILGLTKGLTIKNSNDLTFAGFFEFGLADTVTSNTNNNTAGIGNADYYGLGILTHYEMLKNFYLEGFFKGGYTMNEYSTTFESNDILFNSGDLYLGAGLSTGYKINLNTKHQLELYARYTFGYLNASESIIENVNYNFDSMLSNRATGGLFYNYLGKNAASFLGVSYEYELDGNSNGTVGDFNLATLSQTGGTVILEFGINSNFSKTPINFGFNVSAFAGKRNGASGSLQLAYYF